MTVQRQDLTRVLTFVTPAIWVASDENQHWSLSRPLSLYVWEALELTKAGREVVGVILPQTYCLHSCVLVGVIWNQRLMISKVIGEPEPIYRSSIFIPSCDEKISWKWRKWIKGEIVWVNIAHFACTSVMV